MNNAKKQQPKETSRESSPVSGFVGKPKHIGTIIGDISSNARRSKKGKRWKPITLKLFLLIFLLCPAVVLILSLMGIGPSPNTIRRFMKKTSPFKDINFQKIEDIQKITERYRKSNKIDDTQIVHGVLACDAISTNTYLRVNKAGYVTGTISDIFLPPESLGLLAEEISKQEELLMNLKNETISDAFIFQYQPLDDKLPPFIVHIVPSNSGKASTNITKTFKKLAAQLKLKNFLTLAYATDGDSAFNQFANKTINRWGMVGRPIIDFSKPMYSNDPLHILKRGRYRLLSNNLVPIFKNDNIINIAEAKAILNLPEVVFYDAKITKMKDSLPIKLFNLENFYLLYQLQNNDLTAYFFPFTMMLAALDIPFINIDERVDFLEIAFHFLYFYEILLERVPTTSRSPQICTKGQKCSMFTKKIIHDIMSTIISLDSIINNYSGDISLNRIGTNPLEHHFGLLRLKCQYNHEFENIILNEEKIQILQMLENEFVDNIIKKRRKTFGVQIHLDNINYGENYGYSNKQMAFALLCKFGLPTQYINFRVTRTDYYSLITIFEGKLNNTINNLRKTNRMYIVKSSELTSHASSGAYIQKRQIEKQILNNFIENEIDVRRVEGQAATPITSSEPSSDSENDINDLTWKPNLKRTRRRQSSSQPL